MKKEEITREKMINTIKEYKTFKRISSQLRIKIYQLTKIIKEDDEYFELYNSINEKKLTKIINEDDEYLINYFKNRNKESLQMKSEDIDIFSRIYLERTNLKINKKCKYQIISMYINLYDYIKNKYKNENNKSI